MADTDYWQALSDAIQRAVNLRVVTMVGQATVTGPLGKLEIGAPPPPFDSIVTDINIVGGDITHIVSDKLLSADHADLRSAHAAAVTQAQDIVARNIGILVTIAKEIGDQLDKLVAPTAGPVRTGQ